MAHVAEDRRIDTLLALALAFGRSDGEALRGASALSVGVEAGAAEQEESPLDVLGALDDAERQAVERRAKWHARLPRDKQSSWLVTTLARVKETVAPLDEHVHTSHIVEALREEPVHVQLLVINHLPRQLIMETMAALRLPSTMRIQPLPPEIMRIVRRIFLSHFVSLDQLQTPAHTDLLSGAELARLVRLLGVRETAIACRGIAAVESVASFLRRFPAEDARAIATHLTTLTKIESHRVAFAGRQVEEALRVEPEPGAMLDRIGMRLLALCFVDGGAERLRYTAQKLPLEAARALEMMVQECCRQDEREMMRHLADETEMLAASLRSKGDL